MGLGPVPSSAGQWTTISLISLRQPRPAAHVIITALTTRNPRPRYPVGTDAHAATMVARLWRRLRYRLTAAKR